MVRGIVVVDVVVEAEMLLFAALTSLLLLNVHRSIVRRITSRW